MKGIYSIIGTVLIMLTVSLCIAQDTIYQTRPVQPPKRLQVAVFAPLYLDSAFDQSYNYRYDKNFPKFFNPGLEFYEGVNFAADSLDKEGIPVDIHIYDTRSVRQPISSVTGSPAFSNMQLIIGHVTGGEAKQLARTAAQLNIPFLNASYPNDAGITDNPNYIILNSTLYTHFNAMYRYLQRHHSLAPIVMFRKKGTQEDRLKEFFDKISRTTASVPLKIKYVTLPDDFTAVDLKEHLDADRSTIAIAGSLQVAFGEKLTAALASLQPQYSSTVFGMPTWWEVTDFSGDEYQNMEVVYTTPFYLPELNAAGVRLADLFRDIYYSRPTDMVFRGFEILYHFTHLLHLKGGQLGAGLNDKRFQVFTEFDIQPVLHPKNLTLDYFENKHIYFVKKKNGEVVSVD